MTKSLLAFACRHLLLMRVAAALAPRASRVRSVRHAAAAAQDSDRPDVGEPVSERAATTATMAPDDAPDKGVAGDATPAS